MESRTRRQDVKVERRARRASTIDRVLGRRLGVPDALKDPNKVYAWVTDSNQRVERAYAKDYDFVKKGDFAQNLPDDHDIGDRISQHVGTGKSNEPLTAYLMSVDREFHEEDLNAALDRNDEESNVLFKHGQAQGFAEDNEGLIVKEVSQRGAPRRAGRYNNS